MIGSTLVPVPRDLQKAAGTGTVTIGIRPEALEIAGDGAGIPVIVNLVEELGAEAYVYAQLAEHAGAAALTATPDLIVRVDPHSAPTSGAKIELHVKADSMLLFDSESGARITGS
jgi:multiple sugar transport system ATP-binding protein